MTHDLFGKLKYKDGDEAWAGSAHLPLFAAVGMRAESPEATPEDAERVAAELQAAMEAMRQQMRERFGDRAAEAFAAVDRAADAELEQTAANPDPPDPAAEERDRRRAERRAKNAALLAKGRFPVRVAAPDEAAPTAAQEAAFRFLTDHEDTVYEEVAVQVWESYRLRRWQVIPGMKTAESFADLSGHFAVTRLDISREARGGFAHLVFLLDAVWQDENEIMVVYSPDTGSAAWTTGDGLYDLLESDEPRAAGEAFVPTPHDDLLEAILTDNPAKADELIAAGADINALGPDEYPPLWIAVDQMEVEEVRRLLAFGADPSLANPDEKSTPLKHARKLYRDMGFAPSKKRDAILDGFMNIMKETVGAQMDELKARLEAIIALLEAAAKA